MINSEVVENLNGFSEVELAETKVALHEVAVEMSKLSTNGEFWIAKNSGHNIHVENPELVLKAIKKVCDCHVGAYPSVR
ncbi:hypothetical protein V7182_04345 [Neobacillus drentensis]|uniref:hypothetical protein n=1 Tax=Neobacillus drentensis TaxID=220684 RepID=UPI002FFDFF92